MALFSHDGTTKLKVNGHIPKIIYVRTIWRAMNRYNVLPYKDADCNILAGAIYKCWSVCMRLMSLQRFIKSKQMCHDILENLSHIYRIKLNDIFRYRMTTEWI